MLLLPSHCLAREFIAESLRERKAREILNSLRDANLKLCIKSTLQDVSTNTTTVAQREAFAALIYAAIVSAESIKALNVFKVF